MKTTLVDRALVRLSGDGVRGFLQGLVTNDVLGPLPVWAGLLTPQGKALFDFLVWADGDDLLLDCEASGAPSLMKRLSMYRLRKPIVISLDPSLAVHWSREAGQGVPDPRDSGLGFRWVAPPSEPAIGWLEHRLSRGIVEGVGELGSDKTLWLECNAREQNGVSFTKGCYVGQENTSRMHHRDKVNRRLVVEPLLPENQDARAAYPEAGFVVRVGRITA